MQLIINDQRLRQRINRMVSMIMTLYRADAVMKSWCCWFGLPFVWVWPQTGIFWSTRRSTTSQRQLFEPWTDTLHQTKLWIMKSGNKLPMKINVTLQLKVIRPQKAYVGILKKISNSSIAFLEQCSKYLPSWGNDWKWFLKMLFPWKQQFLLLQNGSKFDKFL